MVYFAKQVFPYLAFFSTGFGIWLTQTQNIILTQVYLAIVFIIAILALLTKKFKLLHLPPFFWFLIASIPGTALYIFYTNDIFTPLRQYLVISIGWIAIWYFFFLNKFSPEIIFRIYLRSAFFASIFAIFQQIFYLIDIPFLYDSRWLFIGASEYTNQGVFLRTPSVFTEPSYFGIFLIPAIYFSFLRLSGKFNTLSVKYSIIFIIAVICTFSTLSFIGVALAGIFAYKPELHKLKLAPRSIFLMSLLAVSMIYAAINIPAVSSRIQGIPLAISGELTGEENISLLVNGINLGIALEAFNSSPIIGHGLGSYRTISEDILYEKFGSSEFLFNRLMTMEDNLALADGGMMYFRLPVEIGIFGCLVIFWFLFINVRTPKLLLHKHIGIASLLFVMCYFLRSGQIFRFELIYFFSLYLLIFSKSFKDLYNLNKLK